MRHHLPILLIVLTGCRGAAAEFPARVIGISDGDTLTVLAADHSRVKIRLHGIDAPETGQDFGSRAKQAASDLAFGKEVTVRPVEKDRYCRTVAEVILPGGRSLNREMVGRGLAWWYRKFAPADRELERLEAGARDARAGL
jgi:micrococcal nuclease